MPDALTPVDGAGPSALVNVAAKIVFEFLGLIARREKREPMKTSVALGCHVFPPSLVLRRPSPY
jgi:hypothetical protein